MILLIIHLRPYYNKLLLQYAYVHVKHDKHIALLCELAV